MRHSLKVFCKIKSHKLWVPVQGQTCLLILESLPGRQEVTGSPFGDADAHGSQSWELVQPQGHWCSSVILEFPS